MILFARPMMYQLLLSQIPSERLHLNKRIASTSQNDKEVSIECEDGTTYKGDILVGADGAYSKVRQSLYEALAKESLLPESDKEQLSVGHVCMVGTTKELPHDHFGTALSEPFSRFERIMMQGTPHSVTCFVHGRERKVMRKKSSENRNKSLTASVCPIPSVCLVVHGHPSRQQGLLAHDYAARGQL